MDTLSGIAAFVKAVEAGSIAASARQLGITPASAGQAIARLETSLGTRLLTRSTRALALTEAGELYFQRVRDLHAQLEQARADVTAFSGEPRGRLRIAASVAFGRHLIAPLLPAFARAHPRIQLELTLADRSVDHVREEFDVSIRFRAQLEPGLIARRIATAPMLFCASPDYLARAGRPTRPEQLQQHDCLGFRLPVDGRLLPWAFITREGERIVPELKIGCLANDIDALAALAIGGMGIARLGSFVAREPLRQGLLLPLFLAEDEAQAVAEPLEFFACWRERRQMPAPLRLFIDYLGEALREHPALEIPLMR